MYLTNWCLRHLEYIFRCPKVSILIENIYISNQWILVLKMDCQLGLDYQQGWIINGFSIKAGLSIDYQLRLDYQIIIKSRLEGGGGPSHIEQSSETPWRESCDVQVKFFSISNVGLDGREARQKTGKKVSPKMWEVFDPNELLPSWFSLISCHHIII